MCAMDSGEGWYGGSNVGDVGGCEVAEWLTASDEYPAASLWERFRWSLGMVGERDETDCLLFLKRLSMSCRVKAYRFPGTAHAIVNINVTMIEEGPRTLREKGRELFDRLPDFMEIVLFRATRGRGEWRNR